jgi:hypothetical protein
MPQHQHSLFSSRKQEISFLIKSQTHDLLGMPMGNCLLGRFLGMSVAEEEVVQMGYLANGVSDHQTFVLGVQAERCDCRKVFEFVDQGN